MSGVAADGSRFINSIILDPLTGTTIRVADAIIIQADSPPDMAELLQDPSAGVPLLDVLDAYEDVAEELSALMETLERDSAEP